MDRAELLAEGLAWALLEGVPIQSGVRTAWREDGGDEDEAPAVLAGTVVSKPGHGAGWVLTVGWADGSGEVTQVSVA